MARYYSIVTPKVRTVEGIVLTTVSDTETVAKVPDDQPVPDTWSKAELTLEQYKAKGGQ
jgi:hypothetical protein